MAYEKEEEKKEYRPLTQEEKNTMNLGYVWRFVYPGVLLIYFLLSKVDINLYMGIALVPYAVFTYFYSRKPSLGFVLTLQKKRGETLHVPENEAEKKRYRTDGLVSAGVTLALAVVFFILWFIRHK